ncbi:MAG: GNAT family N-acetyltransferase [Candidatus Melainabacteria bacterium]|nr:GNAT family N-acetyltransferase [Candidatus Melainabacteria bacterium]
MVSRPEPLTKQHDLSQFDCGKTSLNDWLKKYALQSQSSGQSKTMVTCEPAGVVIGYYSFSVVSVEHAESTPERVKAGLARHSIPIFLLARLARGSKFRGQQLGERLLLHALKRAALLAVAVPLRAVVVDALDENARQFYSSFDFVAWPVDGLRMWILMKDLQKTLKEK